MAKEISPESEIVREYLKRFPARSSAGIARVIFEENPTLFKSAESARDRVRYFRGSKGNSAGERVSSDSLVQRVFVPAPEPEEFGFYILPQDSYPVIIGGDAHIPYHDQDALEMFIERAVEIKAKTVILAGDWIDMYQVSRFSRDPRLRSVKEEIGTFREILRIMREALPNARIIYKIGNHEERYNDYLMRVAPEIFEIDDIRLESILHLKDYNVEILQNKKILKLDHLYILHGHEFVTGAFGNSVNPARGLYLRSKKTAIQFHCHQVSEHTETSLNGDMVSCWSAGCLCGLHSQYMPINKWCHGFAEVYSEENGMFSVRNRKIVNYKLV